jgi:hypothetical protein
VLERWMTNRVVGAKADSFDTLAVKALQNAEKQADCAGYIFSAQLFMLTGNLRSAKRVLDAAATMFDHLDAPHFMLSEYYYRLAFSDAVERGMCSVRLAPTADVPIEALKDSYLQIEIQDLVHDGRPQCYSALLAKHGIDKRQKHAIMVYVLAIDPTKIEKGLRQHLPAMVMLAGRPDMLPIPEWTPDERNKQILRLARAEMQAAEQSERMPEPPGIRCIVKAQMESLSARLTGLLSTNTTASPRPSSQTK